VEPKAPDDPEGPKAPEVSKVSEVPEVVDKVTVTWCYMAVSRNAMKKSLLEILLCDGIPLYAIKRQYFGK